MTKKRNLNLEQISNYQDQNLHSNHQNNQPINYHNNQQNSYQNSFQNNQNQDSFKEQIIAGLKSGKGLTGKDGIFTGMIKEVLEVMLAEELNQHLSEERISAVFLTIGAMVIILKPLKPKIQPLF